MGSTVEDYFDLERRATETPHGVALASQEREALSWADLWKHVRAMSEEFLHAGIVPRSVAALALPNEPEFLSVFHAVTLRAACAPLDLSLTRDEFLFCLSKINASTLVFGEGVNPAAAAAAGELGMRLIRIRCPAASAAGVYAVESVTGIVRDAPRRETNAAVLLHTSATTDTPKLVPLSRENLQAIALQDIRAFPLSPADRYLSLTPLCHAHGLAASLTQMYCGGGVLCGSAFSPADLLRAIDDFKPTWMSAGVPILRTLLALARDNPNVFRRCRLRFIRSTGGTPDPHLIAELQHMGVPVLNGYGLTELPGVTRNTPSQSRPGSAGKSSGSGLAIRDEAGNFLPPDAEGEIVLRGPALTSGYLDDVNANQAAFRDGWFHTGDIGRIDPDGFLFIAGRKKEMINRGGKKILPLEVDNVLLQHPALADAATFAIPHRTLEQEPAAAVVLQPGAEVSALDLRRFAATYLAAYKVPRKIVFVDQIPRATTGKPKRAALSEQFRGLGAPDPSVLPQHPASATEESLIAIWRRILNVERISTADDFFDLGGDSLSAAHMLTQVASAFNLDRDELPDADFFDQPSVAWLACFVAERAGDTERRRSLANRILVLNRNGTRVPIFCFSTAEEDAYQFRHLAQWLGPEQPFTVVCPAYPVQNGRLLTVDEIARQAVVSIRALRPRGPYVIGGHCYGGVVAFETLQQLIAQGQAVALLALFDTPTPGYPKIGAAWRRYPRAAAGMLSELVRGNKSTAFREAGEHLRMLTRIASKRLPGPSPGASVNDLQNDVPAAIFHPAMMRAYRPKALTAPIVHFIGAAVDVSTKILSDPRLGWQDFAGSGYESRMVAGDHVSIFAEANAPALAAEFEGFLHGLKLQAASA